MDLEIAYVHRVCFGLPPGEPPYKASVNIDGQRYTAEGRTKNEAFTALYHKVPCGRMDPNRCYLTGED